MNALPIHVFASEWLKLRSVRSTFRTLGVVVLFVLLCGLWSWFAASSWDEMTSEEQAIATMAPAVQPLVLALPICAAVIGGLAMTSEYATGMIRTSLAVVPRRGLLFAAKAAVAATVTLVTALVGLSVALALGRLIVGDRPISTFEPSVGEQVPHLLTLSAAAAVIALVTCGTGAVLRSTAGTLTVVIVLVAVLPQVANLVPAPWGERLLSVLPLMLPFQIVAAPGASQDLGVLSPAAASAVLAAYAIVALAIGAFSFVRRDS
ncbi:ABC transporter permease [Actinomadura rugatobispora]|uniref:ABC transporter permease n=1 Tax=Actinomadura rugatobispora TaxID=1994 RepID=A0ABW1AI42_9ACTN|nr:ABC transporter permease subunit [Actinomadura rugatobispora]